MTDHSRSRFDRSGTRPEQSRQATPAGQPTTRLRHVRIGLVVLAMCGLLVLIASFARYVIYRPDWEPDSLTWLALLASGLGAVIVFSAPGARPFGFVGVYGTYLVISHLGATTAVLMSSDALAEFPPYAVTWFSSAQRPVAVALSGIGIGAFTLGASVCWFLVTRVSRSRSLDRSEWAGMYFTGMFLLTIVSAYVLIGLHTGLLPIGSSYRDYRAAIRGADFFPQMMFALAVGLAFVLATGDRRQRLYGMIAGAFPLLVLALTGNRSLVLFPAATATAVYYSRGLRIGTKAVVAAATVFFLYIPLMGELRRAGLANPDEAELSLDWTAPLVEIGWTLRPLTYTVGWIDSGETYAGGGTYLLPVQRVLGAIMPFVRRPKYEDNPSYIRDRLPGQGYSVIAEAYYNFGVPGVIVMLGGTGFLLALLGDRTRGGASLALTGGLMAVLINQVRNHSVFVPGQLFGVAVLWTMGLGINAVLHSRAARRSPGRHAGQLSSGSAAPRSRDGRSNGLPKLRPAFRRPSHGPYR